MSPALQRTARTGDTLNDQRRFQYIRGSAATAGITVGRRRRLGSAMAGKAAWFRVERTCGDAAESGSSLDPALARPGE